METGIYLGKIDRIKMLAQGHSDYGDWFLFKLRISIQSNNKLYYLKFLEESWKLQDIYSSYFKTKKGDFKQWRQLSGKTVRLYWDEVDNENSILISIER